MEIHPAARKHGIADEDVDHATTNAIAIENLDDDLRLFLGLARNGEMLEIVAIHAMKMRAKYQRLLPGE